MANQINSITAQRDTSTSSVPAPLNASAEPFVPAIASGKTPVKGKRRRPANSNYRSPAKLYRDSLRMNRHISNKTVQNMAVQPEHEDFADDPNYTPAVQSDCPWRKCEQCGKVQPSKEPSCVDCRASMANATFVNGPETDTVYPLRFGETDCLVYTGTEHVPNHMQSAATPLSSPRQAELIPRSIIKVVALMCSQVLRQCSQRVHGGNALKEIVATYSTTRSHPVRNAVQAWPKPWL
jgi:hypothetical protein